MAHLGELENWFPSGTAEGEQAILDKVFVYVSELKRVLAPKSGNPMLLVGRKGTGKTAVIEFASRILELEEIPSIILQADDLPTSDFTDNDSIGDLKRKFHSTVISAIATKLVSTQALFLAGDDATLYNEAIRSGNRSPDLIGRLARILPGAAKDAAKTDIGSALPTLTSSVISDIESAISSRLVGKRFFVFIDDTDQVANPEKRGHLNRIWAVLLALRDLTRDIPEICVVISLREEVWQRLKREGASQRDQTDHFTNLVVQMESSDAHVKSVVETRLRAAAKRVKSTQGIYETFFEGWGARPPMSEEARSWLDLIIVRSRQRPRDAIQLVASLAEHALYRKVKAKIDEESFRAVMPVFSEERANLFAQEVSEEFPAAIDVIRSFADIQYPEGGFRMTADMVKSHLKRLSSQFAITVFGNSIKPEIEADLFDVWRFLYNANFINARVSDSREKDGYRHIRPATDPMLVSKARWNEMQTMLWEVNPAFRDYLLARQNERQAQFGLPVRRRPTKRGKR